MSNNQEHRDEANDGEGQTLQGYRPRQAIEAEQRAAQEALKEQLLPLWNNQFEVCGLVLKNGTYYAIRNVHKAPEHNFEFCLDDLDWFGQNHDFDEIEGIFHTHPNNRPLPSATDLQGWPRGEGLRYWIVTQYLLTEWERA